jgi:hypothetical protein
VDKCSCDFGEGVAKATSARLECISNSRWRRPKINARTFQLFPYTKAVRARHQRALTRANERIERNLCRVAGVGGLQRTNGLLPKGENEHGGPGLIRHYRHICCASHDFLRRTEGVGSKAPEPKGVVRDHWCRNGPR